MNKDKNTQTTAQQTNTAARMDKLLATFEQAYTSGADYTAALMALSTAVAYSVINKCIDPQRKTAADKAAVSDSGINPALVAIRREIAADLHNTNNLYTAANKATAAQYNKDGDLKTETADPAALAMVNELITRTLGDGLDLVNTAALAILETAAEHSASGNGFMTCKYTARRLSRKVLIKDGDPAKWETVETTPIQEVYKSVRRTVADSRAAQTDPRNGYTYIEDIAADPESGALETVYYRLHKYADIGGYNTTADPAALAGAPAKYASGGTFYTADTQTVADYETTLAALNLTDRQAAVIDLRMRGYGYKAIATYLGVTQRAIAKTLEGVQKKAAAVGFTPSMWAEMTAEN